MFRILLFFIFHLVILTNGKTQNFDASLGLGLNASQIDGDLFAGYSKLGINGGIEVGYTLNESWRLLSGLSFQSIGSQKELQLGSSTPEEQQKIQLTYLSIPMMGAFLFKDSGFSGIGGGSVGTRRYRTFPDRTDEAILDFFNKTDVLLSLGINYRFSDFWSVEFFANESISLLFNNKKITQLNSNSLRNRYLSFVLKRHL